MSRRRAVFVWGVLLIALFMLSALPVAWASPTQTHGRFTVPTRTPAGSPSTKEPTRVPTDQPSPTRVPTDQPTDEPSPTETPTDDASPSNPTATPTALPSGTPSPATPTTTGTPSPAADGPTPTASPTPGLGTVYPTFTATASPTPSDSTTPYSTLTPTSADAEAQLGRTASYTDSEPSGAMGSGAGAIGITLAKPITVTGSGVTGTLSFSPGLTSSQEALVVTATPPGSGGGDGQRISPLFLAGVAAIILGAGVWLAGRWFSTPVTPAEAGGEMKAISAEAPKALPSPSAASDFSLGASKALAGDAEARTSLERRDD
jgi:hypothetical protein